MSFWGVNALLNPQCCTATEHRPHDGSPTIKVPGTCCCGTVKTYPNPYRPTVDPDRNCKAGECVCQDARHDREDPRSKMEDPRVFASPINGVQSVRVEVGNREYKIADAVTQTRIAMNHVGGDEITVTFKGTVTSRPLHDTPHFNPHSRHNGKHCICRCSDCLFGGTQGGLGTCKCKECYCT